MLLNQQSINIHLKIHHNHIFCHKVVSSKVRLFADDCLIYRNIKNKEDQIALQKDLNLLENWGSTWGMRFNAGQVQHYASVTETRP